MTSLRWIPLGILLLLQADCASSGQKPEASQSPAPSPAPAWALTGEAPELAGSVCAVGLAGPTYFRTDGVEAAEEDARRALAHTLEVSVKTHMLDIQTGGGGGSSGQSVVEVSSFVNEVVIQGSRIVEVWYDAAGRGFAQKPRCTYALVCVEKASLRLPASRPPP